MRLQLVDSVAKAMSLNFNGLPIPLANGPTSPVASPNLHTASERLMIKRTFFRAHEDHSHHRNSQKGSETLKLLESEFYLTLEAGSESTNGHLSASDETTSTSSTVLSNVTDQLT